MNYYLTVKCLCVPGRSIYMGQAADHIHQGMTPNGRHRNPLPQMFTKECQNRLLRLLDLVPNFVVQSFLPHVRKATL